jgi:hypothetical protein
MFETLKKIGAIVTSVAVLFASPMSAKNNIEYTAGNTIQEVRMCQSSLLPHVPRRFSRHVVGGTNVALPFVRGSSVKCLTTLST